MLPLRRPRLFLFEAQSPSSEAQELPLAPCPSSSCAEGAACFTNAFLFPSCWKFDSTKTLTQQLIANPAVT